VIPNFAVDRKHKDNLSTSNNMATKALIRDVALELNREIQEHLDSSLACRVSWTITYTVDSTTHTLTKEEFDLSSRQNPAPRLRWMSLKDRRNTVQKKNTDVTLDRCQQESDRPVAALRVTYSSQEAEIVLDTDHGQDYMDECRRFLKAANIIEGG
jgi:hypothetical protein